MKINEKNLCVFASNPPYDCEGSLNKRGEVNKSFQRRYFVLKGNLLFYFEKRGDKEPLGLIIIEGCTIELSEESDQYCFEIAFNGNRTYVLAADTQEIMETWMKALTCAGYEYKRLIVAELQRQLEEIEGSRNKMLTQTNLVQTTAPKPPPRRQNPFNRPAPPLPAGNGNSGPNTTMPFINGHFGSIAQRNIHFDTTLTGTTERIPRHGKSEFYIQHEKDVDQHSQKEKCAKATTVLNSNNNMDETKCDQHLHTIAFEKLHEKFRHIVMKDINEYRGQKDSKNTPLIEL